MPFGSAPTGLPGPAAVSSASSSQPGWSPWAAAVPHANRASEPLKRFHRRAEADDVVTVGFRRLRAHNTMLTRRDANPAVSTQARRAPAVRDFRDRIRPGSRLLTQRA